MPTFYLESLDSYLTFIRSGTSSEKYAGRIFIYGLVISAILGGILFAMGTSVLYNVLIPILVFFGLFIASFLVLVMIADDRSKQLEFHFPDALALISANLRAGMTLNKAILAAAKNEFGPLEDELLDVGKDVVGGTPISDALTKMGNRVKSEPIKQTMKLVVEGIKSGGAVESLLSEISNDMRSSDLLKEEIKANLAMYTLFIVFAAVIAAPVIYGVSSKFVDISLSLQKPASFEVSQLPVNLLLKSGPINITPGQLDIFYYYIIFVITAFAALIYGILKGGTARRGFSRLPIFIGLGYLFFFASKMLLDSVFLI